MYNSICVSNYTLPNMLDLPQCTAGWKLDPNRAVLLVHDMQKYFLAPFPQRLRESLIQNCALVLEKSRYRKVPVYYTAQPGDMSQEQRGLLIDFWGPGMRTKPKDREIVAELTPKSQDPILTKWRYSAFYKSDLLSRLAKQNRDQIIICGVYAHIGILATAIEAFSNDIQPFIVGDAIGDFSREYQEMAIKYAAERCAVVLSVNEVLQ